ncbi:MAG: phosphotransferase enzyme family protein [bacterium]
MKRRCRNGRELRCSSGSAEKYYRITPLKIVPQPGGWSALAFRLETFDGMYFLKAYSKEKSSTARLTAPAQFYLPVAKWLHDHTSLQGRIVNPVVTVDGKYICEDDAYYYMLFDYIEGVTVGDNRLSADQMADLGEVVGRLHSATPNVPLPAGGLSEDYTLPFCGLDAYLELELSDAPEDIRVVIEPNIDSILKMSGRVKQLTDSTKAEAHRFVLCHTDIHGWNLMVSDRLILVDWENLKLAPPEHDLYMLLPRPYVQDFMGAYRRYMPEYCVSERLLEFYTIRRELEDIWEWIKQLRYDHPDEATRGSALHWLRVNVDSIVKMASMRRRYGSI